MIGIPGSGKTTYIKNNPLENEVVISPDELRKKIFGNINVNDKKSNKTIFETAFVILNSSLKDRKNVSFDATNVNLFSIENILNVASKYNEDVCFVVIKAQPEICKKRIKNDLKNNVDRSDVPLEVVDKMFNNLKNIKLPIYEWGEKFSNIKFSLFYET